MGMLDRWLEWFKSGGGSSRSFADVSGRPGPGGSAGSELGARSLEVEPRYRQPISAPVAPPKPVSPGQGRGISRVVGVPPKLGGGLLEVPFSTRQKGLVRSMLVPKAAPVEKPVGDVMPPDAVGVMAEPSADPVASEGQAIPAGIYEFALTQPDLLQKASTGEMTSEDLLQELIKRKGESDAQRGATLGGVQ